MAGENNDESLVELYSIKFVNECEVQFALKSFSRGWNLGEGDKRLRWLKKFYLLKSLAQCWKLLHIFAFRSEIKFFSSLVKREKNQVIAQQKNQTKKRATDSNGTTYNGKLWFSRFNKFWTFRTMFYFKVINPWWHSKSSHFYSVLIICNCSLPKIHPFFPMKIK